MEMRSKKRYINNGKTIKEMLNLVVKKFPGEPAFKRKEQGKIRKISFFEMLTEVRNLGTALYEDGLGKERVAIIGENSYPWFQVFLSIVCGGGVAVPLDRGFTATELRSCLERSDAKAIFCDKKHEPLVKEALTL